MVALECLAGCRLLTASSDTCQEHRWTAKSVARLLLWVSVRLALAMTAIVVVERAVSALVRARRVHIEDRYGPLVRRALAGDDAAVGRLVAAPARHRLAVARLLIEPLIDDRDPARIARTRAIVGALSFIPIADRYLRSWLWWRRAVALRALGVLAAARPHGGGRRRARRPASRRPRRGAGRADLPARRHLASRGRRATARRVAAPRPPAGRARGVRAGVRGLPARVVAGRRRAPGQLRAARSRSAARAGRARCSRDGRTTRVPRSAPPPSKRSPTWAWTPRRPAWRSRRSRAPTKLYARWPRTP